MPKFDKPDSPNIIWGVNALEEDLTRPSDSKIQTGWIQEKPPYEFENYSMNKLYQGFAYYNQLGFPEWDNVTEYQAGKSYIQGSNNRVYKCIQTHTNRNPATSGNEDWWELFEGNRQATTSSRGTVELATDSEFLDGISSTISITPSNISQIFSILTESSSSNGYFTIPMKLGGNFKNVIVQWSEHDSDPNQSTNITFPQQFPEKCLTAFVTDNASDAANVHTVALQYNSLTRTGVTVRTSNSAGFGRARILSIGY